MTTTWRPYCWNNSSDAVLRGPGHATETGIAAQEVLQRDRSEDAPLGLPFERFLGLERGLQAVGPVSIGTTRPVSSSITPMPPVPDE